MQFNKLTTEEEEIIVHKGTEAPYSGEYEKKFEAGMYVCRRCGASLYESKNKFDAHCGWPSFDDEVRGAIKKQLDADGSRTEIICANCGAHLGHVFTGENLTPKNTRHCVNSISMRFVPQEFQTGETSYIVLGGGCFWCLEPVYKELRGVLKVISGYSGGYKDNPTYEEVSAGNTGHAEVVRIEYDQQIITLESILEVFFSVHDPTTLNRQGNDVGEQYRSVILYVTWRQKLTAEKFIEKLQGDKIYDNPVVTELKPLVMFYPAEEQHQNYYLKNPNVGYCQLVINPKLKKFREKFKTLLKTS